MAKKFKFKFNMIKKLQHLALTAKLLSFYFEITRNADTEGFGITMRAKNNNNKKRNYN